MMVSLDQNIGTNCSRIHLFVSNFHSLWSPMICPLKVLHYSVVYLFSNAYYIARKLDKVSGSVIVLVDGFSLVNQMTCQNHSSKFPTA